jgi:hypothetical protein
MAVIVQLAPEGSVAGLIGQLFVSEKLVTREPVIDIFVIVTADGPMFFIVMSCGTLDVLTVWVPKFNDVGE